MLFRSVVILALDYHDPEIAFNLALAVRLYRISRRGWPAGAAERTMP